MLAPLALLAFALALFVVLSSSSGSQDGEKARGGAESSSEPAPTKAADRVPKPNPKRSSYTVEAGDSLGAIAEKTGVDVEALELLNPEVDAQALSPGQKLKLRE